MDTSRIAKLTPRAAASELVCSAFMLFLFGSCSLGGSRNVVVVPDERFGHRYEDRFGERETLALVPPDPTESYFYYPAIVESLHVRHAPFDAALPVDARQVEVEVLVKGVLPDDCSELHAFEEWRAGHIIHLTLQMRRPVGAVCRRIGLPFRFYSILDGTYEQGDYVIKMNGGIYAFVIQPERE